MNHRIVYARGIRIHLVEEGSGPLVLLVHGFPESWYSWRHQLPAIAAAGFRAVAIDVRGYGRSSAPLDVEAYGMLHHVDDNLGVVDALGEHTAVVVGHDWGSPIAANSALLRPGRVPRRRPAERAVQPRRGRAGRRRRSPRWAATRSSTSTTSRSRAGPRPRPSPTCAAGCSASTSVPRAMSPAARRGDHGHGPREAGCCATGSSSPTSCRPG